MATKASKLTDEQVQELRTKIWADMAIATPILALEEDDIRRTQVCSNAKSPHCPGEKATHRRAGKVLCQKCAERTGKARARIEARAQVRLQETLDGIRDGKLEFANVMAALN